MILRAVSGPVLRIIAGLISRVTTRCNGFASLTVDLLHYVRSARRKVLSAGARVNSTFDRRETDGEIEAFYYPWPGSTSRSNFGEFGCSNSARGRNEARFFRDLEIQPGEE